jgi:hypothetical protein
VLGAEAAVPQRTLKQRLLGEAITQALLQCGKSSVHELQPC